MATITLHSCKIRLGSFQFLKSIKLSLPIVKPLTKYAEIIKNPNDVKYILEKAFFHAKNGRPGPVWIDVPLDVQKSTINIKKLKSFKPGIKKFYSAKINRDAKKIR